MQTNGKIRVGLRMLVGRASLALLLVVAVTVQSWAADVVINDAGEITISTSKQSIASIMNSIEEQSNYRFFYSESVDLSTVKTVNIENKDIDETLNELLAGTGIAYEVVGKQVILRDETVMAQQAQAKSVSGKVLDTKGQPIPGATIVIKGTTSGTLTDVDGKFQINNVNENTVLQFSFVGMKTVEQTVGTQHNITVNLSPENQSLEEVVAIGYGTMKKRDLTGAVSSVKSEDITANPAPNPMEALQGQVAGLDITRTSGQPGEDVNIQLRGNRSFTASGNPTFYIDGMPGDYSTLNPNDIESIEVLKDASATAVFGSSGANGVILITTKGAQKGKMRINLNAYTGFNGWSKLPQMRYGDDYLQGLRDANAATGNWSSPEDDKNIFPNAESYQAHLDGKYINWADELMQQTAITQNYSMSISGGTDKTRTYFSMNYADEQGQYTGDQYKVYSSNFRVDNEVRSWIKVGANLQTSYVEREKAYAKLENALTAEPLGEVYDENGNYNVLPNMGSTMVNLLLNNQENAYRNQDKNIKIYMNPYIEIKPLKGLTFRSRLGIFYNTSRNNYFQGEGSYLYYTDSGADSKGTNDKVYARVAQNQGYGYKWENILTYDFKVAEDHEFSVTAVSSYDSNQYDNSWMKQTNIEDNSYLWYNMSSDATDYASNQTTYSMSKSLGFVGRLNYSYLGKYLMSISMRADGSSKLAEDNRWDYFPAISAGWRISDENFMAGTESWLDNLKLRAGYGVTGTAGIDPYSSANIMEYGFMGLGGSQESIYQFSENYANPDLGWEKSYNTNLGVDFSMLRNRVNMTLDWYNTNTKGVIWARDMPITDGGYGPDSPYTMNLNLSETKNSGVELSLNTTNIDKNNFRWTSTLTYTYNKEEITSLQGGDANNIPMDDYFLSLGYPVRSYYQYKLDGIWQLGEEEDAAVFGAKPGEFKIDIPGMKKESDGRYSKENSEGEVIYYDAENKYTASASDYQILGHNTPDWTLGLKNTFEYKGFDLSIFMYMRWGQMIDYDMLGRYDPTGARNFPTYFNYWTPTNASNDFPAMDASRSMSSYIGSSAINYVDGSYFKIKNITLGYSLPKSLMTRWGIENCRVYGTITNPLVIAKSHLLKDYDPEMNGSLDYPLTKQLVFGVNFTF
ncbi:MAG: TonB-dependent receptor [Mangrovibacterium sp.]